MSSAQAVFLTRQSTRTLRDKAAQRPECVNDFATPCVINLLCGVVYLFAPPVLEG
jgi:hypothetical protein